MMTRHKTGRVSGRSTGFPQKDRRGCAKGADRVDFRFHSKPIERDARRFSPIAIEDIIPSASQAMEKHMNKPTHIAYVVTKTTKGANALSSWPAVSAVCPHQYGSGFDLVICD